MCSVVIHYVSFICQVRGQDVVNINVASCFGFIVPFSFCVVSVFLSQTNMVIFFLPLQHQLFALYYRSQAKLNHQAD